MIESRMSNISPNITKGNTKDTTMEARSAMALCLPVEVLEVLLQMLAPIHQASHLSAPAPSTLAAPPLAQAARPSVPAAPV